MILGCHVSYDRFMSKFRKKTVTCGKMGECLTGKLTKESRHPFTAALQVCTDCRELRGLEKYQTEKHFKCIGGQG